MSQMPSRGNKTLCILKSQPQSNRSLLRFLVRFSVTFVWFPASLCARICSAEDGDGRAASVYPPVNLIAAELASSARRAYSLLCTCTLAAQIILDKEVVLAHVNNYNMSVVPWQQ